MNMDGTFNVSMPSARAGHKREIAETAELGASQFPHTPA
jgi:hypothetical protein